MRPVVLEYERVARAERHFPAHAKMSCVSGSIHRHGNRRRPVTVCCACSTDFAVDPVRSPTVVPYCHTQAFPLRGNIPNEENSEMTRMESSVRSAGGITCRECWSCEGAEIPSGLHTW